MQDLKEQAQQIADSCAKIKEEMGKMQAKIVIPEYSKLSKEDKLKVDKEMDLFLEKIEVPDMKNDLANFMKGFK